MNAKELVGAVLGTILKIVVTAAVIIFVYRTSMKAYDYGFRIFAEGPMSLGEGQVISVTITDGKSVKEIGEILEKQGLIRDADLFVLQEKLSEYEGRLSPGIYELSTAMTPEEMMAVMAAPIESEAKEE